MPGLRRWNLGLTVLHAARGAATAFGEKTYLVLSLVAKSLLAWQIFAGSLAS